ncbi:PorP/SprF family type IX secretion system membrane protein [Chitinophagaceae bacterium MMS25-I14]
MKKILLGVGAAIMIVGAAQAQDVHFTQYFASPLTLNPALTGLTPADVRVAANYRTQWSSVSSNPYTTGTISLDMATLKGKLPDGDALGIGLLALYDRAGAGSLQNITAGVSVAYHKAFGRDKQNTISFGIQGFLVQKSIDFNKLKFEDQFDAATGGTPYPTGEQFGNKDLTYPDFNLGLMYTGHINEHATAYVGASYYHLTQPVETFMSGSHKVSARFSGYLGGSFDLNENMVLYASGLYQTQAKATEVLIGGAAGFVMNPGHDVDYAKNTIFYLGAWYRYADALCPYVGFEWSKMQLGISYDANVSKYTAATNGVGAYEISLIFNGHINKRGPQPTYNFACPKF